MGLSGRRRAKPVNRKATTATISSTEENCHIHRIQEGKNKRLGHTYRRVLHAEARERKYTNLLAFQVNRGWNNELLPVEQAAHPEIRASTNANLYNRNMIRLMDGDYTSSVCYSLNKKRRWDFTKQLLEEYDTKEALKSQNVFFTEAVARGRKEGAVRKLVTNATYTVEAANELRKHKKELKDKIVRQSKKQKQISDKARSQLKQQALENDRFQFSDRVKSSQTERPLVTVCSETRGGSVNTASITRTCNLWNNLYNVSPNAEEARMNIQRDYDSRMSVTVGTCVPCRDVDVKRCIQSEKDTRNAKRFDVHRPTPRKREQMIQKQKRFDMEMQLDMDESWCLADASEISKFEEEESCLPEPTKFFNLFDFARPKVSVNRDKKLEAKERKLRQQQQLEKKRKQRSDSDQTSGGSSGYDSGSEYSEEREKFLITATKETDQGDVRLAQAVQDSLSSPRLSVEVPRATAETNCISELFEEASVGSALLISESTPRKLAVMLHQDLSETIVFEEMEETNSGFARFAIYHLCRKDGAAPRTSASEVASQTDPFDFLRRLVAVAASNETVENPSIHNKRSTACVAIAGWKQAIAMSESQARLTAIRALSMFNGPSNSGRDAELVPAPDCEICCHQLPTDNVNSFADGATMLSECGHRFCNRCWLQHVASSIVGGRADVSCPGFQCKTLLDAATLLWFCPADLVSPLVSAAFRSWLSERSDRRQRRLCPQANCGRVLECRAGVNAVCECSGRGLCVGCGQEPHWPSDCATASKYHTRMKSLGHEKLSLRDLNAETDVNAKQCPSCFLIMEKGVGCNHMSCPCGEHFCWWCGQPMRTHSSGPCFGAQSNGRSRSDFRLQRVFTAQDSFLVPTSTQSRHYCAAVRVRISRGCGKTALRLEGAVASQLTGLFASYSIRFQNISWSVANRQARETAERLIQTATRASYLVEYSYAHLDSRKVDRRTGTAVRALGSHITQLVESMSTEAKDQCRKGFCGPKLTRLACEKLLMMLNCLESKCRLLYNIVANQRLRGEELIPKGRTSFRL